MAAKKKTNFYHIRVNKIGITEAKACEILGVDLEQVKTWEKEGAPIYVEKLLLLWDRKHIGFNEWSGWYFSKGTLRYKKQQWRPDNILKDRQFRVELESETNKLLTILKK